MRLSKFLSLSVAMSRNQAKYFIRRGRVSVSRDVVMDPDFELAETSLVTFDGKPISIVTYQYIILHKPASYVCKTKSVEYTSALELLNDRSVDRYYYFANTLGPEVSGLVLISDDARWSNRMKRKLLTKTCIYQIKSDTTVDENKLQQINKACLASSQIQADSMIELQQQDEKSLLLTMNHPRIHEVIDIIAPLDLPIKTLRLQQVGRLSLGELAEGDYLKLTENEVKV